MIEVVKRNGNVVYISTTDDCGINQGGLFCMVHDSIDNDEYFDYFTISKEEYEQNKNNLEEYIAKRYDEEYLTPQEIITSQIINMLENNIMNDNGNESFIGWCENGDIFRDAHPNHSEEFYQELEMLMKNVAPIVDKLTYNYLAEY